MTTQERLIAALLEKFQGESDTAIAKRCGLSQARFSNYKLSKRDMDIDAVIGCAQALDWDVRATVAAHEIDTAPTPRVRALWKKLAATATLLAVGLIGALPTPAHAVSGHDEARETVHYAKLPVWVALLWLWLRARFGRPAGPSIEARTL